MLVTYGVGLTLGNWLGGRFADRSVDRTLIVTLACLTVLLVAVRGGDALCRAHGRAHLPVGRGQLRARAAVADAGHDGSVRCTEPCLRVEHRRLQSRQRHRRGTGWAVIAGGLGYPAVALAGAGAAASGLALVLLMARGRTAMPVCNVP